MRIVITGGAGFLGTRLARKLLERGTLTDARGRERRIESIVLLDVAPATVADDPRVTVVTGDLADPAVIARAVTSDTDTVFHLAAVVSGQAEADFDIGMRVNLDATRALLERCRTLAAPPKFVFTSSLAVFGGPLPDPVPDDAPVTPQASYGAQKAIGEFLVYDMTRKGFIDGRSLRLPTVTVRPGKPNKAASSFASGIVREPLAGVDAPCPVAPDDADVGAVAARGRRQPDRRPRGARRRVHAYAVGQRARHLGGRRRHGRGAAVDRRRRRRRPREVELRSGHRPHRVDVAVEFRAEAGPGARHARGRRLRGHRARVHRGRHAARVARPYANIAGAAANAAGPAAKAPRTPMPAPPTPLDYANAVARNVVPLAGILFLGWSAANVLILYFVDTLLAMVVIFAGLMRHFMPPPKDEGWAARANAEAGYVGVAFLIVAFFAVPLGVPLIFMLAGSDVSWRGLLGDQEFRIGLVLQAIAAFWSGHGLYQALRVHTPEELRLKRRFALVFLRWMAVVMSTYMGVAFLLGRFAPIVFVAVYTAATIMIDVAPDRFLRAMPGGAVDADPLPGDSPTPSGAAHPAGRQRKKRRR